MHGVDAWMWRCGDGGGSETASPLGPSEEITARPPETLALHSLSGTGSWSTPKITSAPAAMAPAEKPPSPEKRSTTFIYLSYCFEAQRRSHRSVSHTKCQLQHTYHGLMKAAKRVRWAGQVGGDDGPAPLQTSHRAVDESDYLGSKPISPARSQHKTASQADVEVPTASL